MTDKNIHNNEVSSCNVWSCPLPFQHRGKNFNRYPYMTFHKFHVEFSVALHSLRLLYKAHFVLLRWVKSGYSASSKERARRGHEGPEGKQRYSSTLTLTSALDLGGWIKSRPGPRKWPGTLGGYQGRSGRVRKISPPPGFDPRTVQPVASRYTDWAILAHSVSSTEIRISRNLF